MRPGVQDKRHECGGAKVLPMMDLVTGLPWSEAVRHTVEKLIQTTPLHFLCVRLSGLGILVEMYGEHISQLALRQVVRRINRVLDPADHFARHGEDALLIVTMRSPDEVAGLTELILREVRATAIHAQVSRQPVVHLSVASGGPATDQVRARELLHSLMCSAESGDSESQATSASAKDQPPPSPFDHRTAPRASLPVARDQRKHLPRITLERVSVAIADERVVASCTLSWEGAQVSARATGENADENRMILVAEAAAKAATQLLPAGCEIRAQRVSLLGSGGTEGVFIAAELRAPEGNRVMLGIAPTQHILYRSVAHALINAITCSVDPVLDGIS